ncbi:MAG: bifunctional 4-hydroxy-3-methylbut-2-enyl diphosphate reductase/30S ribosomal protein S1 [Tissierellia bacterium]|nr:bifunctional 4-hydroxy-3-methylbut-2-enyl diphosphate reductase/30S ribosomal protein S1 [Tissierellia bacterium]
MKIYIADHAGFCFGVKRAIEIAENALEQSKSEEEIYSLGPLVHNPQVVEKFNEKGLKVIDNPDQVDKGKVIIRSHGISGMLQNKLESQNLELIDTTCPYVKSVHKKVKDFHKNGYKIVIIGDRNHPEVIGINGWCNNEAIIINSEEEAANIPDYDKICVVSQTTNTQEKFNKLSNMISHKGKDVEIFNTICNATNQRQLACEELAKKVDAMIVIGGYHSSNTNKLVEVSKRHCSNVYHIETHDELNLEEISKFNSVGLTAGASTPDWIIKEVVKTLENINDNKMMEAIENTMRNIRSGEIIKGKVISVSEDEIIVNINYKSDGVIPKEEISNDSTFDYRSAYKVGDEIEVYVLKKNDGDGNVILSRKMVENIRGWDELERIYKEKEVVECKTIDEVKGGLSVLVKGMKGFIPASQISVKYVDDLSQYKGRVLNARIIELNKKKNRIILSSKEVEKENIAREREKLWDNLEVGKIIEGEVKRIADFGAFVDIGGVDGLIHISDLSWERVNHPSEVLSIGEKVKVQILNIDSEKNRISLGLKHTLPKPWDIFVEKRKVGDIVTGKVIKIVNYGAFVRLEEGVDGLIHISQISTEHISNPSEKLKVGDTIQAMIINIDEKEQKIGLSTKAIEQKKAKELEDKIMEGYNKQNLDVTIEDLINKNR